jgi:hypothetical protein
MSDGRDPKHNPHHSFKVTVPRAAPFEEKPLRSIHVYRDGIGRVDLVDHMGTDLTIVNSARVSFGKHKETIDEKMKNWLTTWLNTGTLLRLSTTLLLYVLWFLCLLGVSIIVIALGATTKYLVVTLM